MIAAALVVLSSGCGDDDTTTGVTPDPTSTVEPAPGEPSPTPTPGSEGRESTATPTPTPMPSPTSEATSEPIPTPEPTTSPEPTDGPDEGVTVTLAYRDGSIEVADDRIEADLGDAVTITATSDVAEELHVHGYDLHLHLAPDVPGELSFVADVPGIFEVEMEGTHTFAFELAVG